MSGIMGIYQLDDCAVDRKDLERMIDKLAHRGPDRADQWIKGCVGLGHRLLWTTPESLLETQPEIDPTGNLVITADARIDNRDELIAGLAIDHCPSEKITDCQLILAAYQEWGEACPDYLLGDFAFAIWDQTEQSLFCARDHFGVKPFYYYHRPDQLFLFASEIKALFCIPIVPQLLNEVRIADFLSLMMEDKVSTTYQEILRLPPAHSMVVTSSGIRTWSYWSLDPQRQLKLNSDQDYADTFREIFTQAVQCRLRSVSPVISHLSGGLDSSAVTCVARTLLAQAGIPALHTISSVFDTITECDERPFIDAVLAQGGLIPHYVAGDEVGPLSNLDHIFQFEDEALLGPSHFYPWVMNRAVKALGLRVCLDGFDGDTVVGHGISRLTELARQGDWKTLLQEIKPISAHYHVSQYALLDIYGLPYLHELIKQWRWIAFGKTIQRIHRHLGMSRKRLLIEYGLKPLFFKLVLQPIRQFWAKVRQSKPSQRWLSDHAPLVNSAFAQQIGLSERFQQFQVSTVPPLSVREEQWRTLTQGMFSYTFEQIDQYAAMFSLEARHPFMDKRLVEFCLSLPAEQKLYQGWGRVVMRRALAGVLPEQVQWRGSKTNLSPNFDDGLFNRNRQLLDRVMSEQIDLLKPYVNVEVLQAAYKRMTSTNQQADKMDSIKVWQAVILALWLDDKQVTP
jgi:asparagine synthase (glutamine-hydrolysing)